MITHPDRGILLDELGIYQIWRKAEELSIWTDNFGRPWKYEAARSLTQAQGRLRQMHRIGQIEEAQLWALTFRIQIWSGPKTSHDAVLARYQIQQLLPDRTGGQADYLALDLESRQAGYFRSADAHFDALLDLNCTLKDLSWQLIS